MKKLLLNALYLLAFVTLFSCSSDDDGGEEEDFDQQIENFVTQNVLDELEMLGFNFVESDAELDFSGSFEYEPLTLEATNIPNDIAPGTVFAATTFNFSAINNDDRTFTFSSTASGTTNDQTDNTFYTAMGSTFNAFIRSIDNVSGGQIEVISAISGTITDAGIVDAQYAVFALDDFGDPGDVLIEIGEGRLFIDGNDLADRQSTMGSRPAQIITKSSMPSAIMSNK